MNQQVKARDSQLTVNHLQCNGRQYISMTLQHHVLEQQRTEAGRKRQGRKLTKERKNIVTEEKVHRAVCVCTYALYES